MLTMAHHPYGAYGYSAAVPSPRPRQFTGNGTSSAFSAAAREGEDWTQIQDLAERRRIQNRIAQRNYRKKLKDRLATLERQSRERSQETTESETSGANPAPSNSRSNAAGSKNRTTEKRQRARTPRRTSPSASMQAQGQITPPMRPDEYLFPGQVRDGSSTPPMMDHRQFYPPPPSEMHSSFGAGVDVYQPVSAYSNEHVYYSDPAMTLPSMSHFDDATRRGISDDSLSWPAYTNYSVPGIMAPSTVSNYYYPSPYEQMPMPLTPQSSPYGHSTNGSDAGHFDQATTPEP